MHKHTSAYYRCLRAVKAAYPNQRYQVSQHAPFGYKGAYSVQVFDASGELVADERLPDA